MVASVLRFPFIWMHDDDFYNMRFTAVLRFLRSRAQQMLLLLDPFLRRAVALEEIA